MPLWYHVRAMVATPVPAATVILLRDAETSPEVLLQKRHGKSEFLPDLYVFPGGRVEDEDHALADRVSGLSDVQARAALPTVDGDLALGFFVAAIRETYEESGILLARRADTDALLDERATERLAVHRLAVQKGDASFRKLVEDEDLDPRGRSARGPRPLDHARDGAASLSTRSSSRR